MEFWVIAAVLVFLVLAFISIYNRLMRYRVECENAWSQIDVQLKRRTDLIPNLVETVKGYMKHEQETLVKVMEARQKAVQAQGFAERVKAEGEISQLLSRLMAVWENYPDLKADQNARALQEELITTENRIAYARGHYNDVSANYNTMLVQFPSNIVASWFAMKPREFFQIEEAERAVPKVRF